jgi:hypothetical protein
LDKRAVDAEIKQEQMANDTNWKAWLQNMPWSRNWPFTKWRTCPRNLKNALLQVLATMTKNKGSQYERKYLITKTVLHISHVSQILYKQNQRNRNYTRQYPHMKLSTNSKLPFVFRMEYLFVIYLMTLFSNLDYTLTN